MALSGTLIILENLTELNRYGVAFLFSFDLTWLICVIMCENTSEKIAGYATLF